MIPLFVSVALLFAEYCTLCATGQANRIKNINKILIGILLKNYSKWRWKITFFKIICECNTNMLKSILISLSWSIGHLAFKLVFLYKNELGAIKIILIIKHYNCDSLVILIMMQIPYIFQPSCIIIYFSWSGEWRIKSNYFVLSTSMWSCSAYCLAWVQCVS